MKNIFLTAILVLILTTLSLAQQKDEAAVAGATEQLRKAMVDADRNALEKLLLDKLSYGHSGGHIDTKKEFIDKLSSGSSDFVTIELKDQVISVSGKTAIVRHKLDAKTNDGGKTGEVHLLVLLVWQKQGGKWKLLARQAVKT